MITHATLTEWYERWFGARRDATTQAAIAELREMLGPEKLEDKVLDNDMSKVITLKEFD